ncbi:adenosylmethionine decarboxylase [Rhizobium sp. RU36D]|uniref:adenosylmethionine decarboxylase n=1 Tax=Rhizobium sp. RU36D TaxID=1907415 RepID=UPI001FCDE063|nr:adenosylmethionine decarboxylase [Rhizobium sp. RU36D]
MMSAPLATAYLPGMHVIADFWGVSELDDIANIERALVGAASACGATLLEVKLHQFGDQGGITGVALLAESHISIHTWPELRYAALDVFVCGGCNAEEALEHLRTCLRPGRVDTTTLIRGQKTQEPS